MYEIHIMVLFLQDFSKGVRLEELNVLLKQTVMVCCCTLFAFWYNV